MARRYLYKGKVSTMVYGVGEVKPNTYIISHVKLNHPDFQEVGDFDVQVQEKTIKQNVQEVKPVKKSKKKRK